MPVSRDMLLYQCNLNDDHGQACLFITHHQGAWGPPDGAGQLIGKQARRAWKGGPTGKFLLRPLALALAKDGFARPLREELHTE